MVTNSDLFISSSSFGCGSMGKRTGIILNSAMDDFGSPGLKNYFGLPGSPPNFIEPRKRPLNSMSPTIIADAEGNVKLVLGAAGGTKIITSVAMTIMRTMWFGQDIKQAIDAPRFHHQLEPMVVEYEYGTQDQIVKGLEAIGHKTQRYHHRGSVICAIQQNKSAIYANADFRKAGDVFGF